MRKLRLCATLISGKAIDGLLLCTTATEPFQTPAVLYPIKDAKKLIAESSVSLLRLDEYDNICADSGCEDWEEASTNLFGGRDVNTVRKDNILLSGVVFTSEDYTQATTKANTICCSKPVIKKTLGTRTVVFYATGDAIPNFIYGLLMYDSSIVVDCLAETLVRITIPYKYMPLLMTKFSKYRFLFCMEGLDVKSTDAYVKIPLLISNGDERDEEVLNKFIRRLMQSEQSVESKSGISNIEAYKDKYHISEETWESAERNRVKQLLGCDNDDKLEEAIAYLL